MHLHHAHAGPGRHRPVPARADRAVLRRLGRARSASRVDELMALGHRPGDAPDERFNMAVMGLRLAGRSNAVAKLHGEVSREMFGDLWPDVPAEEVPIRSVTNGVHAHTWVAPEMGDLLTRYVAARVARGRRRALGAARRRRATTRCGGPASRAARAMVAFVRQRLRAPADGPRPVDVRRRVDRRGARPARRSPSASPAASPPTSGRTLLLSQPERLKALLLSADRPVQFVFAGKAHPADDAARS